MEKRKITCIECPKGCTLRITIQGDEILVTGNDCIKGKRFGEKEMTNPTRTIASTARTIFQEIPVVSVRTEKDVPKDSILDVIKEINKITIEKKYKVGDVVISSVAGTDSDIIVTTDMTKVF